MRMHGWQRSQWKKAIGCLRGRFDPGVPIDVRTVKLAGDIGYSLPVVKLGRLVGIKIRIAASACYDLRFEKLVHEWAHAMECEVNFREDGPRDVHGETWGVWYAKIYRFLYDEGDDESAQ